MDLEILNQYPELGLITEGDPYKEGNKINWGQIALDLIEGNKKTLNKINNNKLKNDFYVVELDNADWNRLFLVKAFSIKEAIEKVWIQYVQPMNIEIDEYSEPYYKSELHAIKVSNYFDETTDVVCLE